MNSLLFQEPLVLDTNSLSPIFKSNLRMETEVPIISSVNTGFLDVCLICFAGRQ